jgi:hypothetical protein
VFLIARIDVAYGQLGRFNDAMSRLVPLLAERGWRLVAAYVSVIGPVGQVIDVFEVPDANAVPSVLEMVKGDPAFAAIAGELVGVVREERTMLAAATPYSP